MPKLLVIFAHPDDEVLALGARMERLEHSILLTCTDGAPQDGSDAQAHGFASLESYRLARRAELIAALQLANLPETIAKPLLMDQTANTGRLLADQSLAFHLVELTRAVAHAITRYRPEAVLTHPYEGGHPDHDACAFAVQQAVDRLQRNTRPVIVEAPFYHARGSGLRTGQFLQSSVDQPLGRQPTLCCTLSSDEQQSKRERLACFPTQQATLAQFSIDHELFRVAPRYDFSRPPHAGQLYYERFPWGVAGQHFRELALSALATLDPSSPQAARP